jgi:hypothetical protein
MKNKGCYVVFIILILGGLGFGIAIRGCFHKNDNNPYIPKDGEVVKNSSWNGSVRQVEDYLRSSLNDWGSYESIEWGPVRKISASNYDFVVRHKFRSKNQMGGMVLSNKLFYLNARGEIVDVQDYKK